MSIGDAAGASRGRGEGLDPVLSHGIEGVLSQGDLVILGRIASASNATLVCDAIDGEHAVRCVYKPIRGEVPLWDFPDGTLAGREVASYLVSRALRWDVIPVTVFRDGPLGPGMVQRWIEIDGDTEREGLTAHGHTAHVDLVDLCPPDAVPAGYRSVLRALDARGEAVDLVHADDPRLLRMAVLDVVINNADRKGGHVLEGVDGTVYGVDHGICLHTEDKLRTVLWGWAGDRIPDDLSADVAALAETLESASSPLHRELRRHITAAEVDALTLRALMLVDAGRMPFPPGNRPIPWPPF